MKNALFIRLDKIGDLVLTLPCDQRVRENYDVHWITPMGLDFVVESCEDQKTFTAFQKNFSWKRHFRFVKLVRQLNPEVSLCFHVPWWIHFGLWLSFHK